MSSGDEKFDAMFLNIAQTCGSIAPLMDSFFGFLARKTDFMSGEISSGEAKRVVNSAFDKYYEMSTNKRNQEIARRKQEDEDRSRRKEAQRLTDEAEFERLRNMPKIEDVTDEPVTADVPESAETPDKEDTSPPPKGNGGDCGKYTWTQTLSTVDVHVPVKPGVKARDIICDFGLDTIKVGIRGEPLIMSGKLFQKIKPDDSTWTLIDNKTIHISFDKHDAMRWWECVVIGDAKIDTKKIVPENSKLGDLDGETRGMVEKMMFDQQQKQKGLPTSDELKQHDILEKIKRQHPEMDFSNCKVNLGGSAGGMPGF